MAKQLTLSFNGTIPIEEVFLKGSATERLILSVRDIYLELQRNAFVQAMQKTSILQQYLNIFSQLAIVMLSTAVKAPNFYYILFVATSVYFPQVTDWQQANRNYDTGLFGQELAGETVRSRPVQQNFVNFGLSTNAVLNLQQPLVVIALLWVLVGALTLHLEFAEPAVRLQRNADADVEKYVRKRLSPVLVRVLRFLQRRLLAVHECYFLMITLSAALQAQAIGRSGSLLASLSLAVVLALVLYEAVFLWQIGRYLNDSRNELAHVLFRFGGVVEDLKFVARAQLDALFGDADRRQFWRQLLVNNYHLLTVSKKLLIALLLYLLNDCPIAQTIALLASNALFLLLLLLLRPYVLPLYNVLRAVQESLYLALLALDVVTHALYDRITAETPYDEAKIAHLLRVGWVQIGLLFGLTACALVILVAQNVQSLLEARTGVTMQQRHVDRLREQRGIQPLRD